MKLEQLRNMTSSLLEGSSYPVQKQWTVDDIERNFFDQVTRGVKSTGMVPVQLRCAGSCYGWGGNGKQILVHRTKRPDLAVAPLDRVSFFDGENTVEKRLPLPGLSWSEKLYAEHLENVLSYISEFVAGAMNKEGNMHYGYGESDEFDSDDVLFEDDESLDEAADPTLKKLMGIIKNKMDINNRMLVTFKVVGDSIRMAEKKGKLLLADMGLEDDGDKFSLAVRNFGVGPAAKEFYHLNLTRLVSELDKTVEDGVKAGKIKGKFTEDDDFAESFDEFLFEGKKRYVRYEIEKSQIRTRPGYMAKVYKKDGSYETTFGKTKKQVKRDVEALMKFDEDVDFAESFDEFQQEQEQGRAGVLRSMRDALLGESQRPRKQGVTWHRKQAERMIDAGVSEKKILAALQSMGATKDQAKFYLDRAKLQKEDVELDEGKKTYVVNVLKRFRGIGDQGRVVKANSEEEAIKIAAKLLKKKPSYLEVEGTYEDVELGEERVSKKDLAEPWKLTPSQWMVAKGVHQPWVGEISHVQYSRLGKQQQAAYDKKRRAEWEAAAKAKKEWQQAVVTAHKAGKFDVKDRDVTPEAKSAALQGRIAAVEAEKEKRLKAAERENEISNTSDLKAGDTVYSVRARDYVKVQKVFKNTVRVDDNRGGSVKEKPNWLQWLSNKDLKKKVLGEDVELDEAKVDRVDMQAAFPTHHVKMWLEKNAPRTRIAPESVLPELKKVKQAWTRYFNKMHQVSGQDRRYSAAYEKAELADVALDRVIKYRKAKDWNTLNNRMRDAERVLYNIKEDAELDESKSSIVERIWKVLSASGKPMTVDQVCEELGIPKTGVSKDGYSRRDVVDQLSGLTRSYLHKEKGWKAKRVGDKYVAEDVKGNPVVSMRDRLLGIVVEAFADELDEAAVVKPKSVYDRYPENKMAFKWSTPAKDYDYPWRVADHDGAEALIKGLGRDFIDVYVTGQAISRTLARDYEKLFIGLRNNRDRADHQNRLQKLAAAMKKAGLRFKVSRSGDRISGIVIIDDIEKYALKKKYQGGEG